jgi:hypothetical protein
MIRAPYLAFVLLALNAGSIAAEEGADHSGHHVIPHHWVAGVVGYALERKREKDKETLAIGVEYGYRFSEKWGIGAVYETLGADVVRDTALVAPVSFHPHAGWRLFAGPGIEFTDKHDDWMLRFGAGYEFELSDHWTLAPEFVYDVIESGKRTYILALALGYAFQGSSSAGPPRTLMA